MSAALVTSRTSPRRPFAVEDSSASTIVRTAADRDPLAQAIQGEQTADAPFRGHPDDAVALRRRVADDLGDRVARDRDAPEARRDGMARFHDRIRPDREAGGCYRAFCTLPPLRQRGQT